MVAEAVLPAEPSVARATSPLRVTPGVIGVFLCGVFAFLGLYATQPILPLLQRLFGVSKAAISLTVSASTLGVAIAAPLLGVLTERLRRKTVILTAVLALALPTLAVASAGSLYQLIAWRFLQGVITPGVFATTIAYITEQWPPGAVAPVMSVYVSGTALGGFLGRTLTGVMAAHFGWRASFVADAALTILGAVLLARLLPPDTRVFLASSRHRHTRMQLASLLRLFSNRRLLATYVIGFNVLFSLVGVFTYITFYLAAPPFSLSTERLSYLFTVYLVGLLVTPLAGTLLPRTGLRAGIAGALLLALGGVLITLLHSLLLITAGLALCCTGVFIAQACATSFLREAAPPEGRASAVGLYVASYYIGGTVAGVVPSYFWKLGGWPACAALIGAVDIVSIAVALIAWRPALLPGSTAAAK